VQPTQRAVQGLRVCGSKHIQTGQCSGQGVVSTTCVLLSNSEKTRPWRTANPPSRRTALDILRDKCNLRITPVSQEDKSFEDSIYLIRQLLKKEKLPSGEEKPRLFFMNNCKETITEMELYGWKNTRHPETNGLSDKVRKINDDFIDPLRYIVMSKPRHHINFDPISYSDGYTRKNRSGLWGMLTSKKVK